ncbi:MAG: DUF4369 domain-containing protein, partial [Muribaculaceae bacterium]|nr:DUF4369 domain-containing protein [Muribaculaceae bacterium]
MKKYITCGVAALAVLATASCGAPSGWSVSGDISGAPEGSRVALEGFNNGRWYLIDSLDVDSKGRFGYKSGEALHFADIMRVSLPGNGSIYFPADSVDHITIDAAYADFSTDYSIGGNPMAADIMAVDSVV